MQAIVLVLGDHGLIEVDDHFRSEKTLEMVNGVFREGCGIGKAQFVAGEEFVR
ncbi:MAG TPA: hypothetical protein VGG45_10495 [Terracidiphilus sp.]